jgi:hypothetical protein
MIERQPFGRTGHDSSRVIFGAAALGAMRQERADEVLAGVRAAGLNHIDTAAGYGASEDLLKPFLAANRDRFYLATKTGEREGDKARAELERSLERMGVDDVDLIKLHNIVEPDEWEVSVLVPFNHSLMANDAYRTDAEALLDLCAERNVAVQTIKSIAKGRWSNPEEPHYSWYEPLTDPAAIGRAVHYVLANERLFLNTSSDARLLPQLVEAASGDLTTPTDEELAADEAQFGITPLFDGKELERI